MYLPAHFQCDDRATAAALMREHPLASLISNDDEGLPFVTHLPLHLEERGEQWVLIGHCARANPHWRYLRARPRAVVAFLGPHGYQTPRIYNDVKRVPSWNYLAVHCVVDATVVDAPEAKDAELKKLIADHEPAYAAQWRSLDADFAHGMLGGMVAFELPVASWQCKLKLNQHRPDALPRLKAGYAAGDDQERALARWMDRLGLGG